jgi:hypothetical protein
VSPYLWIVLASVTPILISVVASLRKYLVAVSLTGRTWISSLADGVLSRILPSRKAGIKIQITIDGDTLEIVNATAEQQQALIKLFLSRQSDTPTNGGVG